MALYSGHDALEQDEPRRGLTAGIPPFHRVRYVILVVGYKTPDSVRCGPKFLIYFFLIFSLGTNSIF